MTACPFLVCRVATATAYLGSEGVRRLVQSLLDRVLPHTFEELIVLTRITIAAIWRTVKTRREALTVELKAARVATIAGFSSHWRGWGQLGGQRRLWIV